MHWVPRCTTNRTGESSPCVDGLLVRNARSSTIDGTIVQKCCHSKGWCGNKQVSPPFGKQPCILQGADCDTVMCTRVTVTEQKAQKIGCGEHALTSWNSLSTIWQIKETHTHTSVPFNQLQTAAVCALHICFSCSAACANTSVTASTLRLVCGVIFVDFSQLEPSCGTLADSS